LDNKEISISKVENWNDKNTVGESFRNVQDDSSSQKSAFQHIENLFDPNLCVKQCMTSDSCRKVQEGYEVNVDHKETLRTKTRF
jgi:transcriptional regulator CtsR